MIDPLLAPSARRVAPVVPQKQKRKRAKPARVSKIITAGASATALFTMVAAMGWQSSAGAAGGSVPIDPPTETPPVELVVPTAPTTTATTTPAPVVPNVAPIPVAVVPVTTVPVAAPAPVVVPQAVPVTVPAKKKVTKHKSNTTTKTSG
ncbi:MAG TPA: hypothetical protein VHN36_05900 [Ilumatobacteraceae bacterium]|nr:hypothetical protein [Ilumatobacteraceae bacterium]